MKVCDVRVLVLDIVYLLAVVCLSPLLLYRMVVHGRYRRGWGQRWGGVPRRTSSRPVIWIHAVSVGEVNAAVTIITQLERALPAHEVVISVTTDTGMARAEQLFGDGHRVFYFPWDFSAVMRRAFGRLRPCLCILMELELWPNFSATAKEQGVPIVVANARISAKKGFPRYQRLGSLVRPLFERVDMVLAQEEVYAERFRVLGVPAERIRVVGSLKFDTADVGDPGELVGELPKELRDSERAVWTAGSTGPGEEAMVLEAYGELERPRPRLIVVPRKPERFKQVGELIRASGFELVRFSEIKGGTEGEMLPEEAVVLGDTMGDLRKFYALAQVIFVGRSLVPMGGSDMIEAAALGKAVVTGPYTDNFTASMSWLKERDGIAVVQDERELGEKVSELLGDEEKAQAMGQRGRQAVIEGRGATQRTVEAVLGCLQGREVGGMVGEVGIRRTVAG